MNGASIAVPAPLSALLARQVATLHSAVSIGCLGAIAEFHDDDATFARSAGQLTARSPRGGLAITLGADVDALAYEALSAHDDAWQYGIALVARGSRRQGVARDRLTELGPDAAALDPAARTDVLFDLGIGMANVDYCVRTGDRRLLAALRSHVGEQVVAAGHPLIERLIDASPHRVVCSPIARIEVYQGIDRERTPDGPHTHLLPALLARRRAHAANLPLPPRTLPLLTVHPANPLFDAAARRQTFTRATLDAFEAELAAFGVPEYVAAKRAVQAALAARTKPEDFEPPRSRIARLALKLGLRQFAFTAPDDALGAAWRRHFLRR